MLDVQIFDFSQGQDSGNEPLAVLAASPARNTWARCGYTYPARLQEDVVVDANPTLAIRTHSTQGVNVQLYVYALWRARLAQVNTVQVLLASEEPATSSLSSSVSELRLSQP